MTEVKVRKALERLVGACSDKEGRWAGVSFINASKLMGAYLSAKAILEKPK